jgi:peptidoglycan/LPS O-acetylase OafA/YrhL
MIALIASYYRHAPNGMLRDALACLALAVGGGLFLYYVLDKPFRKDDSK